MTIETLDHNTLRHLVEAGAVRHATAVGDGDTWAVVVPLRARRAHAQGQEWVCSGYV